MDACAGRILAPALLDRRFQIIGLWRAHCRPAIRLATPLRCKTAVLQPITGHLIVMRRRAHATPRGLSSVR